MIEWNTTVEWMKSALVTAGLILSVIGILYLKEHRQELLIKILVGIIAVLIFIGMTNVVHSLIYELIPSW